jgi:hypothetical protein
MASPEGEKTTEGTQAAEVDLDKTKRAEAIVTRAEQGMKRVGEALERPIVGASVAGGLLAAAAGAWGPTEAVLGAAAGLFVYSRLRRRRERMNRSRTEAAHEPMPESIH